VAARSRISIDPTSGAAARPRRRALRALAASAAALVAPHVPAQPDPVDGPAPACVLTPEQTEGPFFVDERLQRSDIRADARGGAARTGVPLALTLRLSAMTGGGCAPLRGAIVDVWHCDAAGLYSDEDALRTGGSQFLRGYQVSDANGRVRFATIYPGAYRGRAVHIHFKVRVARQDRRGEFTSQLYFDDRLTDRVHASAPYAGTLRRRTRNDEDGLFRAGGRALMLDVREAADGYVAAYDVGLRVG
jgi:protocatechuate 3,4-dioxygenase beta subunit